MPQNFPSKIRTLYLAFDGKLVGRIELKQKVCEVVLRLPLDIQTFVTNSCWFVGSFDDAWAFAFNGNDLKDQHLIFLSDDLFTQDEKQIRYTIAHEIGHVVLKHRNSIGEVQTKEEIAKQEQEADAFAKQYNF